MASAIFDGPSHSADQKNDFVMAGSNFNMDLFSTGRKLHTRAKILIVRAMTGLASDPHAIARMPQF